MTNEEIQLYNDIVKVGFPVMGTLLGGVIGAFSTFFVTKLNHGNENKKEAINKRHELVFQAASDITEFEHLIGVYATALSNDIRKFEDSIDSVTAKHEVFNRNQSLRRARMTLKVLGLSKSEVLLDEYLVLTREVMANGTNLTAKRSSELARVISKGPVEFYKSLEPELSVSTRI